MSEPSAPSFGPSALMTPANVITVVRLLLAPVAFVMIIRQESSWPLFALWLVITTTDSLDGYLARKQAKEAEMMARARTGTKRPTLAGAIE